MNKKDKIKIGPHYDPDMEFDPTEHVACLGRGGVATDVPRGSGERWWALKGGRKVKRKHRSGYVSRWRGRVRERKRVRRKVRVHEISIPAAIQAINGELRRRYGQAVHVDRLELAATQMKRMGTRLHFFDVPAGELRVVQSGIAWKKRATIIKAAREGMAARKRRKAKLHLEGL